MDKRILEAAYESEPELMGKVAQVLSEIKDPEVMKEVFQNFETISTLTLEKCAAIPDSVKKRMVDAGKYAKGGAALIGAAGAAALGTSLAAELYDYAKRGLTKERNYKRIMKYNPRLKDEVASPERLKPAYDALHRYAPDFTADPMLGASLLKSLANQPAGNEHILITALLNSRKSLGEIKNNQFKADFRQKDKDTSKTLTFEQRMALEGAKPAEQHLHPPPGSKMPRGFGGNS